jgi:hypothetical protein
MCVCECVSVCVCVCECVYRVEMKSTDELTGVVERNKVVFWDKELTAGNALLRHSGASQSRQPFVG